MENSENELVKLYLDGFPEDGETFARYFVRKNAVSAEVLRLKGKPVSVGYLIKKKALTRSGEIAVGYLSALSTLTQFRGRGLIASVMEKLLRRAETEGCLFAALSPFNPKYYLRYGFKNLCFKSIVNIVGGQRFTLSGAGKKDYGTVSQIYRLAAKGKNALIFGRSEYLTKLAEAEAGGGKLCVLSDKGTPFAFFIVPALSYIASLPGSNTESDKRVLEFCVSSDYDKLSRAELLKGYAFEDLSGRNEVHIQALFLKEEKGIFADKDRDIKRGETRIETESGEWFFPDKF